jgi:hypothetical protein
MRVIGKGNVMQPTETKPEPPALTGNQAVFAHALRAKYVRLFMEDTEYAHVAARTTPEKLADIMTRGLLDGSADKDGAGIRGVCRDFGIKHTYKAIREFLKA